MARKAMAYNEVSVACFFRLGSSLRRGKGTSSPGVSASYLQAYLDAAKEAPFLPKDRAEL
jgi:hypothetical protein